MQEGELRGAAEHGVLSSTSPARAFRASQTWPSWLGDSEQKEKPRPNSSSKHRPRESWRRRDPSWDSEALAPRSVRCVASSIGDR